MIPHSDRVASIRYVKVKRRIHWLEQKAERHEYELTLTPAAIISHERSFRMNSVTDISCRPATATSWFLYLHTIEGLFAFETEDAPHTFISRYQGMKNR
ncbi:hypothetical protein [Edaphobacillus lindanitolerans]|uniref:Uncharacterized protein n=1 Tax=Edaphobacillus lindanitolerans TaxID=550447 RepID=A0A1U7PK41_9BACI|nr:hypothetical protein [Edaphobacillus lindanitolerans]SIT83846.1 hypothetical protein SAMN05428946_1659 [Edaphobacillus lindanitolerans]